MLPLIARRAFAYEETSVQVNPFRIARIFQCVVYSILTCSFATEPAEKKRMFYCFARMLKNKKEISKLKLGEKK